MSGGKRRGSSAGSSGSKKHRSIREALLGKPDQLHKSLQAKYVGTHLLIKASALYARGKVPSGEKNYNFQYIVTEIDEDGAHATIEFEKKFIEDGGTSFKAYPIIDAENDFELDGYRVALIKEDSELYNHYLGIVNKHINDLRDLQNKGEEEKKRSAAVDTSDIERKIHEEGVHPYVVLLNEFEPVGEREQHIVSGGKTNVGKVSEKQTWSKFVCLRIFGICIYLFICCLTAYFVILY